MAIRRPSVIVFNDSLSVRSDEIAIHLAQFGLDVQVQQFPSSDRSISRAKLLVVLTNSENGNGISAPQLLHHLAYKRRTKLHTIVGIDTGARRQPYSMNTPDGIGYIWAIETVNDITNKIYEYFIDHIQEELYSEQVKPKDQAHTLTELLRRLDTAADSIADLRINSTSDVVGELRSISQQLRLKLSDSKSEVTVKDVRATALEALTAISKLFDYIENSRLAAIIVSGATTALMGCSGFSATASITIMLASWHGKDAFIAAINKVSLPKSRSKK